MSEALIDAIAEVLRGHGINETADDLHFWRCYMPDRYGSCTCFAELLTAIEAVLPARPSPPSRSEWLAFYRASQALIRWRETVKHPPTR